MSNKLLFFKANGAYLTAEYILRPMNDGDLAFVITGVLCGDEYLDDEEKHHLFETNPELLFNLADIAMLEDGYAERN
jgi:hypothetical protein